MNNINDKLSKKINNWLFIMFILSILPTFIFGLLNNYSQMQTIIWIWDILSIFLYSVLSIAIFGIKRIDKYTLKYFVIFVIIVGFQYLTYIYSLQNNLIEILYMVLPITYLFHFLNTFVFVNSMAKSKIDIKKFLNLFLVFVVISCAYNIFKNYGYIFNVNTITSKYINISSFFQQRNAFGQLCFFGIVANTYLLNSKETKKKKIYYILSFILIFANLIFSFSRTSIFAAIIFIVTNWMLNNNIFNKKNVPKIIGALVIVLILFIIITKNDNILNFLDYYVFRKQDGLTGRSNIWGIALSKLRDWHILIGYGLGSSPGLLKTVDLYNSHNTYIELLLTGGIMLFLFYLAIYLRVLKTSISINNKVIRNHYISFFLSFIVYMFFEKVLLFGTGYAPIMFTIFIVILPVFDKYYYEKNTKEGERSVIK